MDELTAAQNCKIVSQSKGCITFVVDENLEPRTLQDENVDGRTLANWILDDEDISPESQHIIATSFANDENLLHFGKDAFYKCVVEAYARHKSLTFTPDMIWLLICQGFARYVNAHAEQLRNQIVNHTRKMDLIVKTDKDLLSEDVDWAKLLDGFGSKIDHYTKNGIAKTIIADFTTTGPTERIASQITLMETVKTYFNYIVGYCICGIPTILLKGTVDDWQRVFDKTMRLKSFGIDPWINSLQPILTEFINAANGQPNKQFWQSIVKKCRVNQLDGGGCIPFERTKLDGWLLKLFPNNNGKTIKQIGHTEDMPSELVRVDFKYQNYDDLGNLISETPMELCAGFVGAEFDATANMLTPKIGWLVRVSNTDEDTLRDLQNQNERGAEIILQVKEVPKVLSKMQYIHNLHIAFTGDIILPDWLDKIKIDYLTVSGTISNAEKKKIIKRFPNISIVI